MFAIRVTHPIHGTRHYVAQVHESGVGLAMDEKYAQQWQSLADCLAAMSKIPGKMNARLVAVSETNHVNR